MTDLKTRWWQAVAPGHLPSSNMPVWVYRPEIGNEEEGYGYVEVGWYNLSWGDWRTVRNEVMNPPPLLWAWLENPSLPVRPAKTPEEALRVAHGARERLLNRGDPVGPLKQE
jgi:hypothetical protein